MISLSLLFPILVSAQTTFHEEHIHNKIEGLVKTLDQKAFISIAIQWKKNKFELNNTPFILEQTLIDQNEFPQIQSIKIDVYSEVTKVPEKFQEIITLIVKPYGAKPVISWNKWLLSDYLDKTEDSLNKALEEIKNEELKENEYLEILNRYKVLIAGAVFLFTIIISLGVFTSNSRKIVTTIESGMSRLGESMENISLDSSSQDGQSRSDNGKSMASGTIELAPSTQSVLGKFSLAQLKAIFSDCYWSHEDEYASFCWKQIDMDTKTKLLDETPFMAKYVEYILELKGVDKKMADSPYYFYPMPIELLSNENLAILMEEHPALYLELSPIRQKNIHLSPKLRIKAMSVDPESQIDNSIFTGLNPSVPRVLDKKYTFSFNSMEEEVEILSMSEADLSVIKSFPSIGWGLRLPEETLKQVLDMFNAKELALAWIAPVDVLEKFKILIPEKKAKLLESYLETMKPDRTSDSYKRLTIAIIQKLDESEMQGTKLENSSEAA